MKAVLDHIGIAVKDLDAALAFYRDALGLEIEGTEDVPSQQVRVHFAAVGGPKLELLEATAPTSPIPEYNEKRGPGLDPIPPRGDEGARALGEHPRPGAEGLVLRFIHPSSTGGVLIELKQGSGG